MRLRTVVGALGLIGTALALGLVLVPTSVQSIRPVTLATSALPTENPEALLLGLGFVVGLAATVLTRAVSDHGGGVSGSLVQAPPEVVQSTIPTRPGREFDRRLDRAYGEDLTAIREALRATAVETLVSQNGADPADARARIERGSWTDDQVATAFLGAQSQPLVARLRGWLDPAAEWERRVQRTVAAIERLEGRA